MIQIETDSPEQTRRVAAKLGALCETGDVILLEGPLGAGKTCFAKGLAQGLEITSVVRSPSFVLLSRYPGRVPLAHLDLYRIDELASIDDLGLEEQLEDAVLVIEWGDKVRERWGNAIHIRIVETGEQGRRLEAHATGPKATEKLTNWHRSLH